MPTGIYERQHTPLIERFWAYVEPEPMSGCWLWIGSTRRGYGYIGAGGREGRNLRAHRFAYTYYRGEIPAGLELDHLCRVRSCVNPAHLEAVSHPENMTRARRPCRLEHAPGEMYIGKGGRRRCRGCIRVHNARKSE